MPPVTFTPGNGRLALDRYDFQNHVDGYALPHNADAITVSPTISIDGYSAGNVYSALAEISNSLTDLALSGKGFLQIGDGYDTYANSLLTPDTPYDSSVPALDTYLNDVLNNPSNPLYFRIRDGGVVMIKAGTYKFTSTVFVPPGIIILGEGFGTKIINQMASPAPLFKIKADTNRIPDAGVDSSETFIFCKQTALVGLTIADNFVVPKFLGDLSYKSPINNDSTNALVALEEGASLVCDNVNFVGKTVYSLGTISDVTSYAIAVDSAVPVSTGTRLNIIKSSIDGFAVPIKFTASGGCNDNCGIINSLVRGHGYLNADFTLAPNNTLIHVTDCNLHISNNYFCGNDDTTACLVYITLPGAAPVVQSKSKLLIASNNIAVDRTNNTINSTFELYKFNTTFANELIVLAHGNSFEGTLLSGFSVDINREATLTIDANQFAVDNPGAASIVAGSVSLDASAGDVSLSVVGSNDINITADTGAVNAISNGTINLDAGEKTVIGDAGFLEVVTGPDVNAVTPASGNIGIYSDNGIGKIRDSADVTYHIALDPTICGLRLSSINARTGGAVNGSSTLWYVPYTSGYIALWDGFAWVLRNTNSSISVSVSSLTTDSNYDVFAYWTGSAISLEFSDVWSSNTTRDDALTTQDGIRVKSGDATRRYVGTIRTATISGFTKIADDIGRRFVWNQYNRLEKYMQISGQSGTWNYVNPNSVWRPANNSSGSKFEYVCGEDISLLATASAQASCTVITGIAAGVGVDSSTVNAAQLHGNEAVSSNTSLAMAHYHGVPFSNLALDGGYHAIYWLETGVTNAATVLFVGQTGVRQTGMLGYIHG